MKLTACGVRSRVAGMQSRYYTLTVRTPTDFRFVASATHGASPVSLASTVASKCVRTVALESVSEMRAITIFHRLTSSAYSTPKYA